MAVADINLTIQIGRLTRDAELTYTNNGLPILNGSIAITHRAGKDREPESSFFDFRMFGKFAEVMAPFLVKGKQICLKGYLKQDRWQDKNDGSNRSKVTIMADEIQLVGGNGNQGSNGGNSYGGGYGPESDVNGYTN